MKKYKYVSNNCYWDKYDGLSVISQERMKEDLDNFFSSINNPSNDDEKAVKEAIESGNWGDVFYYWDHNFSSRFSSEILAKFLEECGFELIFNLVDKNEVKILEKNLVEVD